MTETMTETNETTEATRETELTRKNAERRPHILHHLKVIRAELTESYRMVWNGINQIYRAHVSAYGVDPLALSAASRRVARASEDAGAGYCVKTFGHDDFYHIVSHLSQEDQDKLLEIVGEISAAHKRIFRSYDLAWRQAAVRASALGRKYHPLIRPGGLRERIKKDPIWI